MSSPATTTPAHPSPLVIDPKWKMVPYVCIGIGILGAIAGLASGSIREFAYSYLLAFMFFLSICLGALFLVIIHHLFDAGWSVPIRRIN